MYFRARTYDTVQGRFKQRDPIEYMDGLNLYEFVGGNPVNQLDPLGTQKLNPPKTVEGPTPGNCGNYRWVIQWQLNKETTKGGWIVQHVEVTYDVKDCDDKPIDVKK